MYTRICITLLGMYIYLEIVNAYTNIDDIVNATLLANDGVGLVSWSVAGNGEFSCLGSAGERIIGSGKPVDPFGRWHIGSDTKSMTATLMAILLEDGTISGGWDTTLSSIIPTIASKTAYRAVTLKQLVGMLSGIPCNPPNWFVYDTGEPLRIQRFNAAKDALLTTPEVVPGQGYLYSNWGFVVAGHILEEVTDSTYEALLSKHIFSPLRIPMSSNYYDNFGAPNGINDAWGHDNHIPCNPSLSAIKCDNPPVMGPAGTFSGTTFAMAAYLSWHVRCHNGGDTKLLSQQGCKTLHSPANKSISDYGYGWICVQRSWAGQDLTCNHIGSNNLWVYDVWIAPGIDRVFVAATNGRKLDQSGNIDITMVDSSIAKMINLQSNHSTVAILSV